MFYYMYKKKCNPVLLFSYFGMSLLTMNSSAFNRAIAEYLSNDLPYKLSPEDVYVTTGCLQAIDIALSTLARPGANILIPRPNFPIYELTAAFRNIEARIFDLLPEKGWEVDLEKVKALADHNTVAMVIINPSNPCGSVFSYQHLKEVSGLVYCLYNFQSS